MATTQAKGKARSKRQDEVNAKLAKVLGHWIRGKALSIFAEREASTTEIADAVGEPVSNVAYHVRKLKELGLIEEVRTEQRRGAMEHFFKATTRPMLDDSTWAGLDPFSRQTFSGIIMDGSISDAAKAFEAGTIDSRDDRHLSRIPLLLDEQGWEEVAKTMERALDEVMATQAASDERRIQSGDAGFHASASLQLFEMPDPAGAS